MACSEPHDNEVYFVHEFDDVPYPGEDVLIEELGRVCLSEFAGYVGNDYETSTLEYTGSWLRWQLWR